MNSAIDLLINRIKSIESDLSKNGFNEKLIKEKGELQLAIKQIDFINQYKIDINHEVITLPNANGAGYWSYRICIDNESNQISNWTEVKEINGKLALFGAGDKVLKTK